MLGIQPNLGNFNQALAQLAINWREAANDSLELFQAAYQNGGGTEAGTVSFLENTVNLSPADAQNAWNLISYMNTLGLLFNGQATQPSDFNFFQALSVLWLGG